MTDRYQVPLCADGLRRINATVEKEDVEALAVIGDHLHNAKGWLSRSEVIRHALRYTARALQANQQQAG